MAYVGRPHFSLVGIDPALDSITSLTTAADKMIYTTGSDTYAVTPITSFARSILDDADATTVLSTLGVSTYAKTILDDADAAAVRTTLGLGTGATASAYVHPNHSGEVTSTADGATEIADNTVDEANLKVSNAPTNGYYLQAQSGNTGGLTWAQVVAGGAIGLSDSVNVLDVKSWSFPWGYAVNGRHSNALDSHVTRPTTGTYQGNLTNTYFVRSHFYSHGFQGNVVLRTAASGEGWKGNQFCTFNPFVQIYTSRLNYGSNNPSNTQEAAIAFMPYQVNPSNGTITIGQSGIPTMYQPKNGNSASVQFSASYTNIIGCYGANNYVFQSFSTWHNQGANMQGYGHFYLNTDNTMTNLDRDAHTMEWDSSFFDNTGRNWFANFRSTTANKNVYDVGVTGAEYTLANYGLPVDNTENKTKIGLIGSSSHSTPSSPSYLSPIAHTMDFSTTKTTPPTWAGLQAVGTNNTTQFNVYEAGYQQANAMSAVYGVAMTQQYGFYVDGNNSNTTGYNLPTSMWVTRGVPFQDGALTHNWYSNDSYMYWWGHRADGKMVAYQTNSGFNSSVHDPSTGVIPEMSGYSWRHFSQGYARPAPKAFHLVGQDANNPDPCVMVYHHRGKYCMKVVANSGWSATAAGSTAITANGGGRPTIYTYDNQIPCDWNAYYRPAPEFHSIPGERDTFMCIGSSGQGSGDGRRINKFRINSTNGEITYLGSVDLTYLMEAYYPATHRSGGHCMVQMHPIWDSSSSTWGKILLVFTTTESEVLVTIDMPTFKT